MAGGYANIIAHEEQEGLIGEYEIIFPIPVLKLIITNDSLDKELLWKFKEGHGYASLKPSETVSLDGIHITTLNLFGSGTTYRVWGLG